MERIYFIQNFKYCNFIYQSKRFSIRMVKTMNNIMSIANSKYNYDFYHFFMKVVI